METILLVDDEPSIVSLARLYLERDGFHIESAADGLKALEAVERLRPALVVLDVMLPGLDGFEVCRRLRAAGNEVPILMLTARDEDIDKILGLELGADDYLTKPFNPRELTARVKAILRRVEKKSDDAPAPLHWADLEIDPIRRTVTVNGLPVSLRAQEFDLLLTLASQPQRVFTREQLLEKAWGFDFYGQTRTVDVHIAQLRRKLAASQTRIETVTGVGYKFTFPGS
ncbi:MAG: response regulator transcription factor [Anaerolineales bacterium]|nr:response regulator transcription factor [Anaerolineales bacterium]MDW8278002.1 response regulator transcription factor [Anaerolineales bacterium]